MPNLPASYLAWRARQLTKITTVVVKPLDPFTYSRLAWNALRTRQSFGHGVDLELV